MSRDKKFKNRKDSPSLSPRIEKDSSTTEVLQSWSQKETEALLQIEAALIKEEK